MHKHYDAEISRGNDKILGSAQIKISDVLAAGGMKLLGTNDGPGLAEFIQNDGTPSTLRNYSQLPCQVERQPKISSKACNRQDCHCLKTNCRLASCRSSSDSSYCISERRKGLTSFQCPEFAREVLG